MVKEFAGAAEDEESMSTRKGGSGSNIQFQEAEPVESSIKEIAWGDTLD